jgi:lipopolysaccharide export system protein LptA
MHRPILAAFLLAFAASAQAASVSVKIEATSKGVTITAAGYTGTAPNVAYDSEKELITLTGTHNTPAMLMSAKAGNAFKGKRIYLWPNTGRVKVSDTGSVEEWRDGPPPEPVR